MYDDDFEFEAVRSLDSSERRSEHRLVVDNVITEVNFLAFNESDTGAHSVLCCDISEIGCAIISDERYLDEAPGTISFVYDDVSATNILCRVKNKRVVDKQHRKSVRYGIEFMLDSQFGALPKARHDLKKLIEKIVADYLLD